MDYHPGAQSQFDECQIGMMHATLSGFGKYDLLDIVVEDYCDYHPGETIYVTNGEDVTWVDTKLLWGDVVVETGGKLTIQCEVSLPAGARVLVEAGGELVLDGGALTNHARCGDAWRGVFVQGNPAFSNNDAFRHGKFVATPGSRVEFAEIGLRNYEGTAQNPTNMGGIIDIDGADFRNNACGVVLRGFAHNDTNMRVVNCNFYTDAQHRDGVAYYNAQIGPHVLVDGVDDVRIQGNAFENNAYAITPYNYRNARTGILLRDARAEDALQIRDNTFIALRRGVEVSGGADVWVNHNAFEDVYYGVLADTLTSGGLLGCYQNTFSAEHSVNAIFARGCENAILNFNGNTVDGHWNRELTGINFHDNRDCYAKAENNTLLRLGRGIWYYGL